MANTWNQALTTWGQNTWGQQADVTLTLTGVSATSSIGSVTATMNKDGVEMPGEMKTGANQVL